MIGPRLPQLFVRTRARRVRMAHTLTWLMLYSILSWEMTALAWAMLNGNSCDIPRLLFLPNPSYLLLLRYVLFLYSPFQLWGRAPQGMIVTRFESRRALMWD